MVKKIGIKAKLGLIGSKKLYKLRKKLKLNTQKRGKKTKPVKLKVETKEYKGTLGEIHNYINSIMYKMNEKIIASIKREIAQAKRPILFFLFRKQKEKAPVAIGIVFKNKKENTKKCNAIVFIKKQGVSKANEIFKKIMVLTKTKFGGSVSPRIIREK